MAKSLGYLCFFLIGLAVFRLQHIIVFGRDADAIAWNISATVVFVGALSLIALVTTVYFRLKDIQLSALVALTGILAILQFGPVSHASLNTYARLYAAVCIYTSLWKLASGPKMGRAAMIALVAVFVILAIVLSFYLLVFQIEAASRLM